MNEYFAKLFNDGGDIRVKLGHLSNSKENVSYTFYRHKLKRNKASIKKDEKS